MSQARIGQPPNQSKHIIQYSSPKVGFSTFVLILGSATYLLQDITEILKYVRWALSEGRGTGQKWYELFSKGGAQGGSGMNFFQIEFFGLTIKPKSTINFNFKSTFYKMYR